MPQGLEAVKWRLERADQHLATLYRERQAFFDQEDRRIIGHFERDTSEYVFRVNGEPPDPRLGLIVGELGHHLRASLDNLLWQVVLFRGGSPSRSTQFPIYESRERYLSSRRMLRGISTDDRAAIQAVQPYHLGPEAAHTHPLATIAWLNNIDKHRVLHVGYALPIIDPAALPSGVEMAGGAMVMGKDAPSDYFPWWPSPVRDIGEVLRFRFSTNSAFEDRAELVRLLVRATGPNPEMKMQGGEAVDISLSDPKHPLMLNDLARLRRAVGQIVDIFSPRLAS
ncbi:MAG TPA: hypothetical protein VHP56_07735 [Solirubrobacterales bacterium]|nr:hypothetical protein [Solirubrobacterales bacterium]